MVKRAIGWILLVIGILLMITPFVYGLTGFFATSLAVSIPQPKIDFGTQLPYLIAGIILAIVGWMLAKPKSEAVLEKLSK